MNYSRLTQDEDAVAIDEVAKAIRQIVAVRPQLLFNAASKVFKELSLEGFDHEVHGRNKAGAKLFLRAGLALKIAQTLVIFQAAWPTPESFDDLSLIGALNATMHGEADNVDF